MAKPVNRCIFCGRSDLNREHVWPKWAHEFIRHSRRHQAYVQRPKKGKPHEQQADIITLTLKVVCKKHCNAGWMNSLENRVKRILTPLMTDGPIFLDKYNQEILAMWIATKMMVAEFMAPEDTVFSPLDRSLLMGRRIPSDVTGIFIGQYKGERRHNMYMRRGHSFIRAPRGVIPTAPQHSRSNFQEQTFVIGELFVTTLSTTLEGWSSFGTPDNGIFRRMNQIWPYKADFAWPTASPLFDYHAHAILNGFDRFVRSFPKAPTVQHY